MFVRDLLSRKNLIVRQALNLQVQDGKVKPRYILIYKFNSVFNEILDVKLRNVKQEKVVESEITEKTETKRNVKDKPKDATQPTRKTKQNEVHITFTFYD